MENKQLEWVYQELKLKHPSLLGRKEQVTASVLVTSPCSLKGMAWLNPEAVTAILLSSPLISRGPPWGGISWPSPGLKAQWYQRSHVLFGHMGEEKTSSSLLCCEPREPSTVLWAHECQGRAVALQCMQCPALNVGSGWPRPVSWRHFPVVHHYSCSEQDLFLSFFYLQTTVLLKIILNTWLKICAFA